MIKFLFVTLAFLSTFASVSLRAQYRWHTVAPNRVDIHQFAYSCVSCAGDNCTATGLTFDYYPGELPSQMSPDMCLALTSSDGGRHWQPLLGIPIWRYTKNGKTNVLLDVCQQIDSVNALVAGSGNTILMTHDGWRTWQKASGFEQIKPGGDTLNFDFARSNFINSDEGTLFDPSYGNTIYTSDHGQSWSLLKSVPAVPTRNGILRGGLYPNRILTSKDVWKTIDTTVFTFTGSAQFKSTSQVTSWLFEDGDTITMLGTKPLYGAIMSQSTDLGAHWTDFPLPENHIYQPVVSSLDSKTIVIGGLDSLGRLLISKDHGASWKLDTVNFDDETKYYWVRSIATTGSGGVIASIIIDSTTDSAYPGTEVLALLQDQTLDVRSSENRSPNILFPNPAKTSLHIVSDWSSVVVFDALGRAYNIPNHDGTLDVSSLPAGVYYISNGKQRARFVKE
jgi:hypothetical protein